MQWIVSSIILIYKMKDKSNSSNYRITMVSPLLAKLYGSIIENKISIWLDDNNLRVKGQVGFRSKYSTIDPFSIFLLLPKTIKIINHIYLLAL